MAITAFSNLTITISDGGTVPSLDYLSAKTYVNIGSGNVFKISWTTPTASGNVVDNYKVYILKYDTTTASYKSFYSANVGNVNEFYVKADLFKSVTQGFIKLQVYVEVISKYGSAYNCISNIASINVGKGCGTYVRVSEGYKQPIMKRAVAFAKLNYKVLADEDGTPFTDADGKLIQTKVSSVQDDSVGWTLMQEFYRAGDAQSNEAADYTIIDANGKTLVDATGETLAARAISSWQLSDIRYEILTDADGELITDINNNNIYVL